MQWAGLYAIRWRVALVFALGLLAMILSHGAVTAAIIALCLWALRGPYWALQALALSTMIKFLNPDLVGFPAGSGPLFWLVILVAVLRILPSISYRTLPLVGPVLLFSLVALLTSLISSRAVVVSIMKVLSFAAIVSATLVATAGLRDEQVRRMLSWLLTLTSLVLVCSLATLTRPAIAYEVNTRLLHGIINQPQSLGVIAAPIVSALLAAYLLDRRGKSMLQLSFAGTLCAAMLLTQARTAAIAAIAGALVSVVASASAPNVARGEPYARRLALGAALLVAALLAFELNTGKLAPAVESFVMKRGSPEGVKDAFLASRGFGALAEFQHFLDRPLAGNGFGVYPSGEFPVGVLVVAGIPISAPVEKGFLPTAVLEETGILGGAALAYLLFALARLAWRGRSLPLIAAFFASLFINVGEDNLLSPGGLGFYLWLLIGLAVRSGSGEAVPSQQLLAPQGDSRLAPAANLMS